MLMIVGTCPPVKGSCLAAACVEVVDVDVDVDVDAAERAAAVDAVVVDAAVVECVLVDGGAVDSFFAEPSPTPVLVLPAATATLAGATATTQARVTTVLSAARRRAAVIGGLGLGGATRRMLVPHLPW